MTVYAKSPELIKIENEIVRLKIIERHLRIVRSLTAIHKHEISLQKLIKLEANLSSELIKKNRNHVEIDDTLELIEDALELI